MERKHEISSYVCYSSSATPASGTPGNLPHPGFAQSMLGKRHRDSTDTVMTGVIEEDEQGNYSEQELAKQVVRPIKKRARISEEDEEEAGQPGAPAESELDDGVRTPPQRFSVFTGAGQSSDDPPPPTNPLPSFYASTSVPGPSRQTQNAVENHQPFNFNFAVPPSPGPSMFFGPSFPYPEPPQSPTPAGNAHLGYLGNRERTDIFKSFGLPDPGRPRSGLLGAASAQGGMGEFVNPAALTRRPSDNKDDGVAKTTSPDAISPSANTMYGTERDTRFGDFGVEDVGRYWTGRIN